MERASRADFLSDLAGEVKDAVLDVGGATRNALRGGPHTSTRYADTVGKLQASIARLQAAARDPGAKEAARRVAASADSYRRVVAAALRERGAGHSERAAARFVDRDYARATLQLRNAVSAFDNTAHDDQLGALSALNRLWKSSLLLLVIAAAGRPW